MKLYSTPSGLGGTFDVRIIEKIDENTARVRVHMPRNPDWHGYEFNREYDKMKEIKS